MTFILHPINEFIASKLSYKQLFTLIVWLLPFHLFAAQIDEVSILSQNMGDRVRVIVISPISVIDSTSISTVYLLNGFGGNEQTWLDIEPNLPELADKYGVRIVTSDGMDSWYWDSPKKANSKYETFFISELIPYIQTRFKAPVERELTAITGFSMGGHGAFWLASNHGDLFGAIGSISGGLDLRDFKTNWNLPSHLGKYDQNKKLWQYYTIASNVDKLADANFKIIFDCGTEDFFYPCNLQFHELLLEREIPHTFSTRKGKHTSGYAKGSIESHLKFFSSYFAKFKN